VTVLRKIGKPLGTVNNKRLTSAVHQS
jgi:hypothetical protein